MGTKGPLTQVWFWTFQYYRCPLVRCVPGGLTVGENRGISKHCCDAGPSYHICCVPAAWPPGDSDFSRSSHASGVSLFSGLLSLSAGTGALGRVGLGYSGCRQEGKVSQDSFHSIQPGCCKNSGGCYRLTGTRSKPIQCEL